jgi:putative DNA primase/helicase
MKRHNNLGLSHWASELSDVLHRLEHVTGFAPQSCGQGFKARCPAHDDRTPSLSVCEDDGRILLHCHAGCTFEDICRAGGLLAAARVPSATCHTRNLARTNRSTAASARPGRQRLALAPGPYESLTAALAGYWGRWGKPTRVWTYVDRDGNEVGAVARWEPAEGEKLIRPLVKTAEGWRVGAMKPPRPLFRLDELTRAIASSRVYVVEGEKCVDVLSGCYELATTSPGGAQGASHADWSPLAGMDVVIFPDNDTAGEQYAQEIAHRLARLAIPPTAVRVVRLPHLPPGGDVVEFIAQHYTHEQARFAMDKIIEETPIEQRTGDSTSADSQGPSDCDSGQQPIDDRRQPNSVLIRCAADVSARDIEWLSHGYLPKGKLTMLVGDPGVGKSFLTCDLAAAISTGRPWPTGHDTPGTSGHVLLIGCEDDPDDTVVPRLKACGADLSRVHFLEDVVESDANGQSYQTQFTLENVAALQQAIDALPGVSLVIIDPLTAYFGQTDMNKNTDVRAALAPLMVVALQSGVAILAVNHLTKKVEGPAVYRSLGSIGMAAAARSVLAVIHDPNSDHERVLVPVKSNVSGALSGWRYALVDQGISMQPRLEWRGPAADDTAEEYMRAAGEGRDLVLLHALDWLKQRLADGPIPTTELITEARRQEISRRTLFRAKDRLNILGGRGDYEGTTQYVWWLPT